MIKLRLSVDISLSEVILGVAGVTATVCAFQYFKSKHKKSGTFVKSESKFSDYGETDKEFQRTKGPLQHKCDVNSMMFKSVKDKAKHKNKDLEESYCEVLKNDVSFKFQPSCVNANSSDKKAELSTECLVTAGELNKSTHHEVIKKNNIFVQPNIKLAANPKTVYSNTQSFIDNQKQDTKQVNKSAESNENESSSTCSKVLRKDSSFIFSSATESRTDLGKLNDEKVQGNNQPKKQDVIDDERQNYTVDIDEIKIDAILEEEIAISEYVDTDKQTGDSHRQGIDRLNKGNAQTNVNVAALSKTSPSSSESSNNNQKHETKNEDNSTRTDETETSVNCNKVGSEKSICMNRPAANSGDPATKIEGLSAATEEDNNQTKEHDKRMGHQEHAVNKLDVDLDRIKDFIKSSKKHFDVLLKYVVDEKEALESDLEKIASLDSTNKRNMIISINHTFCKRVDDVRAKIKNKKVHGYTRAFVSQICDIEQALWKEAATNIIHPGRFSNKRLTNIWENFDWMKKFLNGCEELINQVLEVIKFMEESLQLKEIEINSFMEHYDELIDSYRLSHKNLDDIVEEIDVDFPSADDLWNIVVDILKDLEHIIDSDYEKILTELEKNF